MNARFLTDMFKTMLMLGHKEVDVLLSEGENKAVIVVPKGNVRKITYSSIDTDLGVLMPSRLGGDYEVNYKWVYDLESKCIETENLESLGCVELDDNSESNIREIKVGTVVADKQDKHTYYVNSVDGKSLNVTELSEMQEVILPISDVYRMNEKDENMRLGHYKEGILMLKKSIRLCWNGLRGTLMLQ